MRTIGYATLAAWIGVALTLPVEATADTQGFGATDSVTSEQTWDKAASHERLAQRRRQRRRSRGWRTTARNRPRRAAPEEEAEPSDEAADAPARDGDQEDVRGRVDDSAASALSPRASDDAEPEPEAGAVERAEGSTLRRSNRMEFDARLVRGETAGSGAVVLFDRGLRDLPPLTRHRSRFLQTTVREVLGRDGVVPTPGPRARATTPSEPAEVNADGRDEGGERAPPGD